MYTIFNMQLYPVTLLQVLIFFAVFICCVQVGDSPEVVTPPHSVPPTVPVSMMLDEDSDADIMYSTEWESSTDEEEKEEVRS